MPVTPDTPAPYGPASAVLDLIERHRAKGLPNPITGEVLQRAGITDSLVPRVLQTLASLDLIDDEGRLSEALEAIRMAPEAEYKQRLKEWLTATYADALQYVDPETADETRIRDAFRSYKPVGQQARMVSLFIALFRAAGVGIDRAGKAAPKSTNGGTPKVRQPKRATTAKESAPPVREKPAALPAGGSLPLPLAGLFAKLPAEGEAWTEKQRDKFVQTFEAVLDFCFPVVSQDELDRRADIERERLEDTV